MGTEKRDDAETVDPSDAMDELTQRGMTLWRRVRASPRPPRRLYHYTDQRGLEAILKGRALRVTHCDFMNDYREGKHARELVEAEFGRRNEPGAHEAFRRATAQLTRVQRNGTFLACFSAHGDLLSQWRAYAGDGAGFAIGLDLRGVEPATFESGEWEGPYLVAVRYKKQDAFIRDLVDLAVEELRAGTEKWPSNSLVSLSVAAANFKQSGFAEEKEWRLVWYPPPFGELRGMRSEKELGGLKLRFTRHGLAPYFDWSLGEGRDCRIREIKIGPKRPAQAWLLKEWLEILGYDDRVAVTESAVSYR
jgi:hypothetical protein